MNLAPSAFSPQPSAFLLDSDRAFSGVNELDHPADLAPGELSSAFNNRCTFDMAEPRLGVGKLPSTNRVTSTSETPLPFVTIYGAKEFIDDDDTRWLIIAADGKVFRTRESNAATEVPVPVGEVISYSVTFEQTINGMIMFRGTDREQWIMDDLDAGFMPVSQVSNEISGADTENPTDGSETIPPADNGEWIGNRLFIPHVTDDEKDLLGISDYFNATRYQPVRSQARINQGSNDRLLRFFKFNEQSGIAFKENSIYIVGGIQGDLTDMTLDELTREYGLAGAQAVVNVGSDVWFLSPKRGIMSLRLTEQNKLQGVDVPVSRKMARTIARIDWRNAHLARFAQWDNKFYAALPLDESKGYSAEMVPSDAVYDGSGVYQLPAIYGATYTWTPGANDTSASGAGAIHTDTSEFIVSINGIPLVGTAGAAVTASVRRVYPDSNNAILVYDFLKQAWAGVDTGSAILVKEFVQHEWQGLRRLFFLSSDGWLNLVEEMFADETAVQTENGDSIVDSLDSFDANGRKTYVVEPGRQYVFSLDASDMAIVNGSDTLLGTTSTNGHFVAQTAQITVTGVALSGLLTTVIEPVNWSITNEEIDHDRTSRGYICGDSGRKRFLRGRAQLSTWRPGYTISSITDGVSEETTLNVDGERDNTRYYKPFNRARWDTSNVNEDHAAPHRQDYSVSLSDDTTSSGGIQPRQRYLVQSSDAESPCSVVYNDETYTNNQTFIGVEDVTTFTPVDGDPVVYPPGAYIFLGEAGVNFDLHQEHTEQFRFEPDARGRFVQVRIRNQQGRAALMALDLEAIPMDPTAGKHS